MGDVDSWYDRDIDVHSWMFDENSWRRLSREDTAGRSLRGAEVGRVVEW